MTDIDPKSLICVAICAGAFGVKGEVKLKSFTQIAEDCAAYGPLYNEAGNRVLTPQSHRVMTHHIALKAAEITQREAAQALNGVALYVPRDVLPETDEDEFYYSDLVGLEVKSTSGQRMGTIIAIHEFGAGDMLEIQPDEKIAQKQGTSARSFFHPFTKICVPKIDLKARRVIIHIIEAENGRGPDSV